MFASKRIGLFQLRSLLSGHGTTFAIGLLVAVSVLSVPPACAGPKAYITTGGDTEATSIVHVIDAANHALDGPSIAVPGVAFHVAAAPSGQLLFVPSYNTSTRASQLSIIDTRTRTAIATVPLVDAGSIAVHPDETRVYLAHRGKDRISVVDVASATVIANIPSGTQPKALVVAPDGRRLYVADSSNGGSVSIYDTANMTLIKRVATPIFPSSIDISPDGRWVYTTHYGDNKVLVLDTQADAVVASIDVVQGPYAVAASPDGTRVYVANQASSTVSVIATATHTILASVAIGPLPLGIAVTPDGQSIYTTDNGDRTVSVIDANTLAVRTITGLTGAASVGRFIGPSPQAAALENPQPASFQSGIGLISGWACAGPIGVAIDGKPPLTVPQGSPRGDTYSECGNLSAKAGFGLLTNFNLLGAGTHTAQLWVGGAPLGAPLSFTVTPPAGEFLRGASKETTVADFPVAGKSTTLIWQEAQQNFAIKAVSP